MPTLTSQNWAAAFARQAIRDLEVAKEMARCGFYEWACFAAQQAAEKMLKAARLALGDDYHQLKKPGGKANDGHDLPTHVGHRATDAATKAIAILNMHHEQARYPVPTPQAGPALPAVMTPPCDGYDKAKSDAAIENAEIIMAYALRLSSAAAEFWAKF